MPRLTVKRITTIGAVESGDNPEADILFWKSATLPIKPKTANPSEGRTNGGGHVDTTLDLSSLDEDQAEPILAFVAGLQKAATEAAEKIAALEAQVIVEPEDDPLVDLPEPVAKAIAERDEQIAKAEAKATAAEEAVAKLQDDQAIKRSMERAETLSNLFGAPAEVAPLLMEIEKKAPEASDKLNVIFDKLLTWEGMDTLLKEHGDNAATGSAADTLTALAKDIQKDNTDMSLADARVEAHHQRPELRVEMREEGGS